PATAATAFTERTWRCAWPAGAPAKERSTSSSRSEGAGAGSFPGHQRAVALVQRPERLFRWNVRNDLEVVPVTLRLPGRFHLQEIHRVDLAAVLADPSFAEQRIVGSHRFHRSD